MRSQHEEAVWNEPFLQPLEGLALQFFVKVHECQVPAQIVKWAIRHRLANVLQRKRDAATELGQKAERGPDGAKALSNHCRGKSLSELRT